MKSADGKTSLYNEFKSGWPRWVSFACIWLWTCLASRVGMTSHILEGFGGVLTVPTAIILFATVATLVVVILSSREHTTIVGSRPCIVGAGLALVGGAICISICAYSDSVISYLIGSCLGGLAIGLLKIAWGEMFSRMDLRTGLIDIGFAVLASTILFLILFFTPRIVQVIAFIACALPCSFLAWYGTHILINDPSPSPLPGVIHSIQFNWTLLILPVLVGFIYGLILYVLQQRPIDNESYISIGMTVADLLAGLFLLIASHFLSMQFGAAQIYSVGIIATAASLMLAVIDAVPTWITITVCEIGFAVFYFCLVVYWGNLARWVNRPLVYTYALGYLAIQAATVPGLFVGYAVSLLSYQIAYASLFAALVLVLFVVVLLVFGNSHSSLHQWLVAGEPLETSDDIPDSCAIVATEYALTPREHEVLILLARGRTAAYIGRTLGITSDTAKVHIRNIYRKMDIHTQQELIELIVRPIDSPQ